MGIIKPLSDLRLKLLAFILFKLTSLATAQVSQIYDLVLNSSYRKSCLNTKKLFVFIKRQNYIFKKLSYIRIIFIYVFLLGGKMHLQCFSRALSLLIFSKK